MNNTVFPFFFSILSETFYDTEEAVRDPDFVKLTKTLDKLYAGAREGSLATIKMMLPPHYTYFDKVRSMVVLKFFINKD
jgi:hypothetical protein